jgi:general secretion pathway protein L
MSSLIVLLPSGPTAAAGEVAYALTPDGRLLESHGSAPPALLPAIRGAGAEVVAVVPARTLSWHRVDLPRGVAVGTPRLREVLEGLLEEQLLDEPESLHFAVQPHAQPGPAWVASCDRAWLRSALQALEAAGRPVNRIVPEFAPEGAPMLYAVGEPEDAQWAWAGPDGVLLLPLGASSLALLPPAAQAEDQPCLAEPAVAALAEQALGGRVELVQPAQRWLQAARSEWDLGQFEFSRSARARALKKMASTWSDLWRAPHWRAARWGAGLLVAVNLLGLNAWAWKERAGLQAKEAAIRGALTETFPQVKAVVDAPVQMEREVAALRQLTGVATGRDLESMLAALGQSTPAGRSVSAIEFNGSQLRARGLGLSPDEARTVAAKMNTHGYLASLEGDALVVTPEGGR